MSFTLAVLAFLDMVLGVNKEVIPSLKFGD